jgi:ABC-2 type transport system permease protein
MPSSLRIFATFVGLGVRRWSTYRLAAAAGAFTNTVFGLIKAAIVVAAVRSAGGSVGGYDAAAAATYVWVGQALIGPMSLFGWTDLAVRIRTGDIAVDLSRPVDPQLTYLGVDLGRAIYQFLPRGLPPLRVGALVTGLALPRSALPYLLGALSVALGVGVSFACRWLLNLCAFWLLDLRGAVSVYIVATNILCGLIVPVHWFPGWLAAIAAATPFPSVLQVPIDVLTARVAGAAAVEAILIQLSWLVALLAVGQLVFRVGARRLVVQGG